LSTRFICAMISGRVASMRMSLRDPRVKRNAR
jgi:hypothetical protein